MNRLIKAEWYKLLRSTKIFWFTLAAIIGIEVWIFSGLANTLKGHLTLDAYITGNSTMIVLGAFMGVILLTINCCMTPAKRLIYYEVMDGNSPITIINSRIIFYGLIFAVIYLAPVTVMYAIVGIHNGVGEYDLISYFISMFIILAKQMVLGILTALLFRKFWGPAIIFAVTEIGFMGYLIIGEITGMDSFLIKLMSFTTIGQSIEFTGMIISGSNTTTVLLENPADYLPKVIVATVIEVGLVYCLTYRKFRKRRYM